MIDMLVFNTNWFFCRLQTTEHMTTTARMVAATEVTVMTRTVDTVAPMEVSQPNFYYTIYFSVIIFFGYFNFNFLLFWFSTSFYILLFAFFGVFCEFSFQLPQFSYFLHFFFSSHFHFSCLPSLFVWPRFLFGSSIFLWYH